jgi:pilus assembly protein CpaC
MQSRRSGAALAPFAALIAGAGLLAAPMLGHAQAVTIPASPPKAVAALKGEAPAARPSRVRTVPRPAAAARAEEPGALHVDLSTAGPTARTLNLGLGKSAVVDLPVDARDVLVTNPAIADAMLRTRRRISVLGVAAGETDAVFFDDAGKRILTLDVHVSKDSGGLADALQRLLPGAKVRVESVNDSLVLAGEVASAADADKARRLAERFVAKPEQVVNLLTVTGKEQVMLTVRVVEMQRTIIKQLGFDMNAVTGQLGMPQYSIGNGPTYGVNERFLGSGGSAGYAFNSTSKTGVKNPLQAQAMLQAFERVGLVRTLAEPNLTALSGESAKFLAGGEYPVPTGEDTTGRVTIEFKPYGVGLAFTPVVLSEGRISLKVSTEVSELSSDGAFTLNAGSNSQLTIPALKLRRTETTVELPSGGAMMISGLLQQQTKQDIDSMPGLANVPILGALFRSRDYLSGETELAIIITPYVVKATSPAQLQTPVDGLQVADDLSTDLLGKLNKSSNVAPAAVAGKSLQGPYGYVIE